jgi:DNA-binding transcriptional MocR family regulator
MMRIPLDRQSAVPLYRQIESYLRQSILSGSLAPDTQLPAMRRLARDLGINRITVENAYAELAAEGPVYDSLVSFKRVNDLATSNLIQRTLEAYVTVGRYQAHLRRSCQLYRKRRDAMLLAINRYLPSAVEVPPPQGGLFVWLRLADNLSARQLLPVASEEGVSFAPGSWFFQEGPGDDCCLRLKFAAHEPKVIEEGIRRLGKAIALLRLGTPDASEAPVLMETAI